MNSKVFFLLRDIIEKKRSITNLSEQERNSLETLDCHHNNIRDILKPYKVDNAVILAAGFSSRFAPLSFETPKGLTCIKGERLIERQIRQLKEAGIQKIILVVGYKAELFKYLESKYDVKIVFNAEYKKRNNNSSIMCISQYLANTYICSCDNYFPTNPFHGYEFHAFYSALWSEGETDEWCMFSDDRGDICHVSIGGSHAWFMNGHAYFDHQFSESFSQILKKEYNRPETYDKHWEKIMAEHLPELSMHIQKYRNEDILEFDSINDALNFDPEFLSETNSPLLDFITTTLKCSKSHLSHFEPFEATKRIFTFDCNSKKYFFVCNKTDQYQNEIQLPQQIKILATNEEKGWTLGSSKELT